MARAAAPEPAPQVLAVADEQRLCSLREYVILNLVFDGFCVLQLLLVAIFLRETRGLYFFFALLMIGFLLVSIFDYVYDRVTVRPEAAAAE